MSPTRTGKPGQGLSVWAEPNKGHPAEPRALDKPHGRHTGTPLATLCWHPGTGEVGSAAYYWFPGIFSPAAVSGQNHPDVYPPAVGLSPEPSAQCLLPLQRSMSGKNTGSCADCPQDPHAPFPLKDTAHHFPDKHSHHRCLSQGTCICHKPIEGG